MMDTKYLQQLANKHSTKLTEANFQLEKSTEKNPISITNGKLRFNAKKSYNYFLKEYSTFNYKKYWHSHSME